MKHIQILSPAVATKWYLFCIIYYVALLPFQVKTPPITLGIMLFGLGWLLSLRFLEKFKLLSVNPLAWLSMTYLLWVLVAAAYAPVPQEAWKDAFAKIPFLIWPLLLGSLPAHPERYFTRLMQVFSGALVVALLAALGLALFRYQQSELVKEFFFSRLLTWTLITPHYLGMYLNFAYGILLYYALGQKFIFRRWLHLAILVILALGVWIMAARIQYVIFIISTVFLFFNGLRQKKGATFALISSAAATLALLLVAMSLKPTRSRIIDTYNELLSLEHKVNNKQTNPRKFLWSGGVRVIAKSPWLGHGLATGSDTLKPELEKMPKAIFWDGSQNYHISQRHYNLHNSYLQHWAQMGLPGLLLLIGFFALPAMLPSVYFKQEARIFLLVAGISFATESMLERQAGILYFSFFYALLFIARWQPSPADEQAKKATTH